MKSFAESIKYWRHNRGLSQLDLSLDANVSSKHISFLETGKSQPSKQMVMHLSQILNIPLFERNRLLTQTGYSKVYSNKDLDDRDMQPVLQAVSLMLENHNPYPALVLDWDWNIIMDNQCNQWINQQLKILNPSFSKSNNIIELLFDPNGYRPFIENWDEVASLLLQRINSERSLRADHHSNLLNRISKFIPSQWNLNSMDSSTQPMITLILKLADTQIKLFSTLTTFGTAVDITMQEMVIEHYFPADEDTKQFFKSIPLDN